MITHQKWRLGSEAPLETLGNENTAVRVYKPELVGVHQIVAGLVLPGAGYVCLDHHAGPPASRHQPQPSLPNGADGRKRLASSAGNPQHEPQPNIAHRGHRAVLSFARGGPSTQSNQGGRLVILCPINGCFDWSSYLLSHCCHSSVLPVSQP